MMALPDGLYDLLIPKGLARSLAALDPISADVLAFKGGAAGFLAAVITRQLDASRGASRALDRALTLRELHAFWRRVENAPESPSRDAPMACMSLGGQRPTPLLRLTPRHVDVSGATATLLDPKGSNRHANPRRHLLPIHEDLMPVIRRRLAQTEGAGSPLFSTNGRVPLRKETVGLLVTEIAKAMTAAGELERRSFSMRDLRRTAETHMAALAIPGDVRAQIQSLGLGRDSSPPLRPARLHA